MREIKFRAWYESSSSQVDSQMLYWWPEDPSPLHYVASSDRPFNLHSYLWGHDEKDPHKVMQYTGLRDKNGVEIYEGDIVKTNFDIHDFHTPLKALEHYEVRFWDGSFCLFSETGNNLDYLATAETCCEVIGNIYENPINGDKTKGE